MRFTKPFWAGIEDGSVTVAFRRWKRPSVVAGRPYRTGGGRIEVTSVDEVELGSITKTDLRRAGYTSLDELASALHDGPERTLYRVGFHRLVEPDPREEIGNESELSGDDVAAITARLDRLDRASKHGPWTRPTLRLIEQHPARRAPDLADMVGRETPPFKLDVRKLKNLGLTNSLRIGYELSPRGRAWLDVVDPDRD